jgi:hypothetical protein
MHQVEKKQKLGFLPCQGKAGALTPQTHRPTGHQQFNRHPTGSRLQKLAPGGILAGFCRCSFDTPADVAVEERKGPAQMQRRGRQAAPAGWTENRRRWKGLLPYGNETEFSCVVSACNLKKQRGLLPRELPAARRCVNRRRPSDGDRGGRRSWQRRASSGDRGSRRWGAESAVAAMRKSEV